MIEALQYEFMRNALLAGLLVSIACGIIGTLVVINRIVFISGGIAHAAYGGIGLGYFFGFEPTLGAIGFSLLAAIGMGAVQRKTRERADTIIGVMWATGMAIGIILIDLTQGYKADLMSYLFGSILAVPTLSLWLMLGVDILVLVVTAVLFKQFLAMSFDETFARVSGVPVDLIHTILVCLIAITVVMMMRVVGLIMVIALLTIPAAIGSLFSRNMKTVMLIAIILGGTFSTVGLWLSYSFNLTSGATIILVSAVSYFAALLIKGSSRRAMNSTTA